jgi:hypothetical protein
MGAVWQYYTTVYVGTPPLPFKFCIIGSSPDTWLAYTSCLSAGCSTLKKFDSQSSSSYGVRCLPANAPLIQVSKVLKARGFYIVFGRERLNTQKAMPPCPVQQSLQSKRFLFVVFGGERLNTQKAMPALSCSAKSSKQEGRFFCCFWRRKA